MIGGPARSSGPVPVASRIEAAARAPGRTADRADPDGTTNVPVVVPSVVDARRVADVTSSAVGTRRPVGPRRSVTTARSAPATAAGRSVDRSGRAVTTSGDRTRLEGAPGRMAAPGVRVPRAADQARPTRPHLGRTPTRVPSDRPVGRRGTGPPATAVKLDHARPRTARLESSAGGPSVASGRRDPRLTGATVLAGPMTGGPSRRVPGEIGRSGPPAAPPTVPSGRLALPEVTGAPGSAPSALSAAVRRTREGGGPTARRATVPSAVRCPPATARSAGAGRRTTAPHALTAGVTSRVEALVPRQPRTVAPTVRDRDRMRATTVVRRGRLRRSGRPPRTSPTTRSSPTWTASSAHASAR